MRPSFAPFLIWLAVFYTAWLALVAGLDAWGELAAHWPIAAAMAAGSYFAGSTPMGGGTVGFPVLTLLFDQPAQLGRNFGLAVQSIGMVSASIFILARGRALDWALLRPALIGAAIATPLGAVFIAPVVPDLWVRLIFAVIWAAFGVIHWLKLREIITPNGPRMPHDRLDAPVGLGVGVIGGVTASVTGVGVDMMLYAALVLFYRTDLKVAIPTSVVLMAFTSVVGIAANLGLSSAAGGALRPRAGGVLELARSRAGGGARRAAGRCHGRTSAARPDPAHRFGPVPCPVHLDARRPAGGSGRACPDPHCAGRAVRAVSGDAPGRAQGLSIPHEGVCGALQGVGALQERTLR